MNNEDNNIVDITGLDPADVLAALYNASKQMDRGFLQFDPKPMNNQQARDLMRDEKYFDYIQGRIIKVAITFESKSIDVFLYNRDNGDNAGQNVILELRTRPNKK